MKGNCCSKRNWQPAGRPPGTPGCTPPCIRTALQGQCGSGSPVVLRQACQGKALCMASSAVAKWNAAVALQQTKSRGVPWAGIMLRTNLQNADWYVMTRHTMSYQTNKLGPLVFYKTKIPEGNSISPLFTLFATVINQVHSYSVTACCIQNTS